MSVLTQKHDSILLIIETVNVLYLLPRISAIEKDRYVTIITLGAGIASFMNKGNPDMNDIATLMPYIPVKEVFDRDSLVEAIQAKQTQYIRVPHGDTHRSIFPKKIPVSG